MTEKISKLKTVMIAVSLIFIFMIVLCAPSYAEPEPLEMKVDAGFNDIARYGFYVPFRITVLNRGPDIEGEVQVIVDLSYDSRTMYAAPINLPEGSTKEIIINVPMYTASRKAEIRVVQGKKVIMTQDYEFDKLLSPNTPMVGILSDDSGVYTELRGIKFTEKMDADILRDIQIKTSAPMATAESYVTLEKTVAEVIQLNKNNFPDNELALSNLDYIFVSNFDTSLLSDKQFDTLLKWVENGNVLLLVAGQHSAKVFGGIKSSLGFVSIDGSTTIERAKGLESLIEKELPHNIYISKLYTDSANVVLEEQGIPTVAAEKRGDGLISVLAFDPFSTPLVGSENSQLLLETVITRITNYSIANSTVNDDQYINISKRVNELRYLASQVPETQMPPFRMMLIIIGVYIFVVGPVLYFVLKIIDKRDLSWVVIPITAVLFMGIIHVAGFKTRFTEAVVNNVSVILLDQENSSARMDTAMAVFSNERDKLRIEYGKDSGIIVDINREYYDHFGYHPPDGSGQTNAMIRAKYIDSDPIIYELYNTRLWEPNYISASRDIPYRGGIFQSFSLNNGILKVGIKNDSGLILENSFISFGNIFIGIGELMLDEEKLIEVDLKNESGKSFDFFINDWLGPFSPQPGNQMTIEMRENNRKRDMINNVFRSLFNNSYDQSGEVKVMFFAFNKSDPGYMLKINGKSPRMYNTNMVYTEMAMDMTPGSRVEYPTGIILPIYENIDGKKTDYYSDGYGRSIRVLESGNYDYIFPLPKNISIDWVQILWPESLYTNVNRPGVPVPGGTKNPQSGVYGSNSKIKYYIYNFSKMLWEETESSFSLDDETGAIVNERNEIRVRISIELIEDGTTLESFREPEISIGGVVR